MMETIGHRIEGVARRVAENPEHDEDECIYSAWYVRTLCRVIREYWISISAVTFFLGYLTGFLIWGMKW
jgi:hypothetical protein